LETLYGAELNPYSVTALENSNIHYIETELFREICNENSNFYNEIVRVVNSNSITIYNRMFSLTQKQLHGRLADILLCLSTRIFKRDSFDLPLSRRDLAALTGMAPESVIRILKEFKTDKIIETKGKYIEILNSKLLKKISDVG
jgi:CRP/FNR family transcriptional regulator